MRCEKYAQGLQGLDLYFDIIIQYGLQRIRFGSQFFGGELRLR